MSRFLRDSEERSYDIDKAFRYDKYIVTFKSVYLPYYSVCAGYYAQEVFRSNAGALTIPGRYYHMTGDEVNRLIGRDLFKNL